MVSFLQGLAGSSKSVSAAWATMSPMAAGASPIAMQASVAEPVKVAVNPDAQLPVPSASQLGMSFAAASAAEAPRKIALYSTDYYMACAMGGVMSCGLTHYAVTPLDVVKCNMQTNPGKYKSIGQGFKIVVAEQGVRGLFKGWLPTLIGYSAQGANKFGFYEYFKK